jgi:Flp pilus assembly protein TadG
MMKSWTKARSAPLRFPGDCRAVSTVEFAIVAAPFIFMLLGGLQIGIYYMTQAALDTGVNSQADYLRSQFASASPNFPAAAALKTAIVSKSGALIANNSTLAVEIQPLANLDAASVAIVDATVNYGSTTTTLVLRAQSSVMMLAPGFGSLAYVRSSAILRRKGV